VSWSGQWPLTSWQNTTLTVALMLYGLWCGVSRGRTPLGLISAKADAALVRALQARFRRAT
jgi:hypothetical protein